MQVSALDHLVLTVADVTKTREIYAAALGMTAERFTRDDGFTRWALCFCAQKINLHQAGQEFKPHAAIPTAGSGDLCFLSDTGLNDWETHLARLGLEITEGPIRRTGARGPTLSIYIRDPDCNLIEISNQL